MAKDEKYEVEFTLRIKYSAHKNVYSGCRVNGEEVDTPYKAGLFDLLSDSESLVGIIEFAEYVSIESICGKEITNELLDKYAVES